MNSSFVVYVDESGDEGFVFNGDGSGSSRWFVLSAAVILDPAVGAGNPFYLSDFSGLSVISWFTYQVNARFCAKPL